MDDPAQPGRAAGDRRRTILVVAGVLGALALGTAAVVATRDSVEPSGPLVSPMPRRSFPPSPLPADATGAALPPATPTNPVWSITAEQLRPELEAPELLDPANTTDSPRHVIDAGRTWVVLSGNKHLDLDLVREDAKVVVHGLLAATGEPVWHRPMRSGLCADELLGGRLACAAAIRIDSATGLGTQWRLELLDPATGQPTAQRTVDGWFTQLEVVDGRLVVLEQRQPAPQAVVRSFAADLTPLGTTSLADRPNHRLMFSTNRQIVRGDLTVPKGPALDRVRVSTAGRWLAVTAGATAFLDPATGRVAAMPVCSRVAVEGARIWCNEPLRARAYGSDIAPGMATQDDVRLGFVRGDGRSPAAPAPFFLNAEGQVVRVEAGTGGTLGIALATEPASSFAGQVPVRAHVSDGLVFVAADGLVGLDAASFAPRWGQVGIRHLDGLVARPDGSAVVTDLNQVFVLDPATGTVSRTTRVRDALYLQPIGAAATTWAGWDTRLVQRVELP